MYDLFIIISYKIAAKIHFYWQKAKQITARFNLFRFKNLEIIRKKKVGKHFINRHKKVGHTHRYAPLYLSPNVSALNYSAGVAASAGVAGVAASAGAVVPTGML